VFIRIFTILCIPGVLGLFIGIILVIKPNRRTVAPYFVFIRIFTTLCIPGVLGLFIGMILVIKPNRRTVAPYFVFGSEDSVIMLDSCLLPNI